MLIRFYSRVNKVERKTRMVKAWKEGDDVRTEEADLGWYILLDGSWELLHVGFEEPHFKQGDRVAVTIEKV